MSNESGIGSLLEGFASGARTRSIMDRRDRLSRLLDDDEAAAQAAAKADAALANGPDSPAPAPDVSGSIKPMRFSDPVATDLAPHQRAFLNAVSDGESAGKYNVRYTPKGGAEFSDLSKHPGIFEPGPEGPSSAAGRYQFTKTTWDRLGGGDFSPANQDRRAWTLATQDYEARTGRDLDQDLRKGGLTPQIMKTLQPTWTSFGTNGASRINAYESSMRRYSNSEPAPTPRTTAPPAAEPKKGGAISIMGELLPTPRSVLDMG